MTLASCASKRPWRMSEAITSDRLTERSAGETLEQIRPARGVRARPGSSMPFRGRSRAARVMRPSALGRPLGAARVHRARRPASRVPQRQFHSEAPRNAGKCFVSERLAARTQNSRGNPAGSRSGTDLAKAPRARADDDGTCPKWFRRARARRRTHNGPTDSSSRLDHLLAG